MASRSSRSPRSSRFSPTVHRLAQSFKPDETSWLQETQDMYRANAVSSSQDSDEMLALLLNAMFICGIGMLMYALCS